MSCPDDLSPQQRKALVKHTRNTLHEMMRKHRDKYDLCMGCSLQLTQMTIFSILQDHMKDGENPGFIVHITLTALKDIFGGEFTVLSDEDTIH